MKSSLSKLSFTISILYLASKCFLAVGYSTGFIIGSIAACFATYKFWQVDKAKMLGFLESLIIAVYLYSFYRWTESKNFVLTHKEEMVAIIGTIVVFLFCSGRFLYVYFKYNSVGTNLVLETIAVATFTLGGMLIAYKIPYGWISYAMAHTATASFQNRKGDYVFTTFQVLSAIISVTAFMYFYLK